ncbi:hypothetical protein GT039_27600 [Streptomyces sp. SID2955]|nr:hypothetical protein [Streptomyces sp. SID2955]
MGSAGAAEVAEEDLYDFVPAEDPFPTFTPLHEEWHDDGARASRWAALKEAASQGTADPTPWPPAGPRPGARVEPRPGTNGTPRPEPDRAAGSQTEGEAEDDGEARPGS